MQRVVILGTGTEVGKTYVTRQLAESWNTRGGLCVALKPVESGYVDMATSDAAVLRRAASAGTEPLYQFEPPISPHLAARSVGARIELERIQAWVNENEGVFHERGSGIRALSLIETAGGAFSPLSEEHCNADMAQVLDPAWLILVAPDRLGVLHDVAATLVAMHATHRTPDLVVLSASSAADDSTGTNARELQRVVFPRLGAAAPKCPEVPTFQRDHHEATRALTLLQELTNASPRKASN